MKKQSGSWIAARKRHKKSVARRCGIPEADLEWKKGVLLRISTQRAVSDVIIEKRKQW